MSHFAQIWGQFMSLRGQSETPWSHFMSLQSVCILHQSLCVPLRCVHGHLETRLRVIILWLPVAGPEQVRDS